VPNRSFRKVNQFVYICTYVGRCANNVHDTEQTFFIANALFCKNALACVHTTKATATTRLFFFLPETRCNKNRRFLLNQFPALPRQGFDFKKGRSGVGFKRYGTIHYPSIA
jgi:hypothetical protein